MALSGLDIYKLLPKTNCRECGLATCLAFAMQLAKKAVSIEKCPTISKEAKEKLAAASLPPIRLIKIGAPNNQIEIGNETVLFRHEEKFLKPCAIGFIIEENLSIKELSDKIAKINKLNFERVGEALSVNLIALRYKLDKKAFLSNLEFVIKNTKLGLVLMADEPSVLKEALELAKGTNPLIFPGLTNDILSIAALAKEYNASIVVSQTEIEKVSLLTEQLKSSGFENIVIDTGKKKITEKLWDLTQIRRLALKKGVRSLGFPVITIVEGDDFDTAMEASIYILKYAGIILVNQIKPEIIFPLLTLRQNIFTDPQKPLQVEPKAYAIGQTNANSPILITTNFSLSYFTVLSEVETSKIPSYILSVDTEGMSVLTAWAAEKFTPESISKSIASSGLVDKIKEKKMIIPGYVAVMSGDIEEKSG